MGAELLLLLSYVFKSTDLFRAVSSVKLTQKHESEQVQDVKDSLCISPGEWLNESEEASDRDWMEAALLALRVTGPSRTGGCKPTEKHKHIHNSGLLLLDDNWI